nr:MAG TPA: hypothetical protein [Caudoviricetes sp.]
MASVKRIKAITFHKITLIKFSSKKEMKTNFS